MNTYKKNNKEYIYTVVLLLVVYIAVGIEVWLPTIKSLDYYWIIVLLISVGLYQFIIWFTLFIISNTPFLMHLYWGKLYVNGYWSYEYTRNGQKYFGIWRFKQDLTNTHVIGSGLNEDFSVRTIVRSVSPLIDEQGAFFVLNLRQELSSIEGFITPVYSKTTLILDEPRNWFSSVKTIRGTTEIYGGNSNAHLHPNVIFKKHLKAKSDEDVINDLKKAHTPTS